MNIALKVVAVPAAEVWSDHLALYLLQREITINIIGACNTYCQSTNKQKLDDKS
jgi:hypothetical protein